MKLTIQQENAVKAMLYLSIVKDRCNASVVAKVVGTSPQFISRTLQTLANRGLVDSKKGPKGGACLGKPASEITVLQVVEAIGGNVKPFESNHGVFGVANEMARGIFDIALDDWKV
jgi:Rrf2 family protein